METAQFDDLMDMGDRLLKALGATKDNKPVVNMTMPSQPTPDVTVNPTIKVDIPEIKIPEPKVTVSQKSTAWKFEVTKRDMNGRIESFTATPKP